jgi:exopolysaccharide biosynthesis polyprenyl glycosylphosphotransferase
MDRTIPPLLLLLDAALTVMMFNVIGHYRGITEHLIFWPLGMPLVTLVFGIFLVDGYNARTDFLGLDYASVHIIAVVAAMIATLLFTFAFLPPGYELQSSRGVIALSFLALIPATIGVRRMISLQASVGRAEHSLVFIGDAASGIAFREECQKMGMRQPIINAPLPEATSTEAGPSFTQLLEDIRSGRLAVEAIILRESNRELPSDIAHRLVALHFRGIPTYTLELFYQVYWRKIPLYRINPTWLFQQGFQITREPAFERLKRVAELILSALGLILALPLLAGIALAIWLEDRGPILFIQNRVGRGHAAFPLVKFRTMRQAPEGASNPYTQADDARITRVGRFLRGKRLDELPQLWNVLRGEMSLIGPRAEWDRLVEEYEKAIPCYYYRHLVKPGITGWAQVNYRYGANLEDTTRKLEYDLYYIRHYSFLLDASIVLKTIHIMLSGGGR